MYGQTSILYANGVRGRLKEPRDGGDVLRP